MANLLTPEGVLLSSSVFEAKLSKEAKPGDKPKYWVRVGFDADASKSPEMLAINAAVHEAARALWGKDKADAMLREGSVRSPFRKDVAAKGYPGYVAVWIGSSALESFPPNVVSKYVDEKTGKLIPVTDKREIYAGCRVRMSVVARAYGGPGTKFDPGISLDLRNVQKLGDGERLSAGTDANEDFPGGETAPPPADPNESVEGLL